MDRFLQYALSGLSAGSLYALVALGLVLVYRSTRVLNFAHADVATLGTFVACSLVTRGISLSLALPLAHQFDQPPAQAVRVGGGHERRGRDAVRVEQRVEVRVALADPQHDLGLAEHDVMRRAVSGKERLCDGHEKQETTLTPIGLQCSHRKIGVRVRFPGSGSVEI